MADTSSISALLRLQNIAAKAQPQFRAEGANDAFTSVLQSTVQQREASGRQRDSYLDSRSSDSASGIKSDAADYRERLRDTRQDSQSTATSSGSPTQSDAADRRAEQADSKAPLQEREDNLTTARSNEEVKDDGVKNTDADGSDNPPAEEPAATEQDATTASAESGDVLTEQERSTLQALPEEVAAFVGDLPVTQQKEFLNLLQAQQANLSELNPDTSGLLEGATLEELQTLQNLLNRMAQALTNTEDSESLMQKMTALIDQQDLPDPLKTALIQQIEQSVAAKADQAEDGVALALAQVVASLQLAKTQYSEAKQASAKTRNAVNSEWAVKVDTAADPAASKAAEAGVPLSGKTQAASENTVVKLQPEEFTDAKYQRMLEAVRVNEAAQRHNLMSAKTEAADKPALAYAASLAQLNSQSVQAAGQIRVGAVQAPVGTSFHNPAWGQAVSQKVVWMVQQGIKSAELRLDPPDLGPLHVKVTVTNEQAQVSFVSQQAPVREALDQNAFRLREMLAEQGMTQVDVGVSDQSEQQMAQDTGQESTGKRGSGSGSEELEADEVPLAATGRATAINLVDQYA